MHIKHIHELIERISEVSCSELAKGIECVDTKEFGEAIDMIKDLAEAEYYARISKKMEECEEEEEEEEKYLLKMLKEEYGEDEGKRYYDNWRYSNGRFAPKGRGRRMGFPYPDMMKMEEYPVMYYPERDMDMKEGRMYYSGNQGGNYQRNSSSSKYGNSFDNYMEKRKGYSISDPSQKRERMKMMEEESGEVISMISEMMQDVSPEEKNILKNKLTKLVNTL